MHTKYLTLCFLFGVFISGCATTTAPVINRSINNTPPPITDNLPPVAEIVTDTVNIPKDPTPAIPPPPPEEIYEFKSGFDTLPLWTKSDPSPALRSFQKSCTAWKRRKDNDWLNPNLPQYGQYKDWRDVCERAAYSPVDQVSAVSFFQSYFEPVKIRTLKSENGLLTGYYAPIISVRRKANAIFSEPILARPKTLAVQNLPRSKINARTSKVLAYGRPIDVFFMQVQGSGRIKFPDGNVYRAAFNGHNSKRYKSIGRVLIQRGDLHKDKASKQDIEDWMQSAGLAKTRALINENPRYIFFKAETILPGSGPRGSMGVGLTSMGSLAIDPRYFPYGSLVYLHVKLPQRGGDYKGRETGLLLSAQDSGGAIKGPMRGDIYFGAGKIAGDKAGVMKHRGMWTVLLPSALAFRPQTTS